VPSVPVPPPSQCLNINCLDLRPRLRLLLRLIKFKFGLPSITSSSTKLKVVIHGTQARQLEVGHRDWSGSWCGGCIRQAQRRAASATSSSQSLPVSLVFGWRTLVRWTGFKTRLRPLEGALEYATGETADLVSQFSLGFLPTGDCRVASNRPSCLDRFFR
jgi:hypothetical protein